MFDFRNRVCLVTGVGNPMGIGFGCAKALGMAGATIIVTSTTDRINDRVNELKSYGISEVYGYVANLCNRAEVVSLIDKIILKFKKIDVLVNNAGNASISERNAGDIHYDIDNLNCDIWDKIINRNLTLNFNVTHTVLPYMKKNKYGRIVHISSVTGPLVTHKGQAAYGASKAGIAAFSKSIAVEYGQYNILSNCILPGWIKTGVLTEKQMEAGSNNPLKRPGNADEVGMLALYLSSSENSYITGQDIVIDGGNCIQEMK